jgi:hypothetical protein
MFLSKLIAEHYIYIDILKFEITHCRLKTIGQAARCNAKEKEKEKMDKHSFSWKL